LCFDQCGRFADWKAGNRHLIGALPTALLRYALLMTPAFLRFGPQFDVAVGTALAARAGAMLENQDNFLVIDAAGKACFLDEQQESSQQVPGWPAGHVRLAVLDGMGGHGFGREAAQAVVAGLLAVPACTTLAQLANELDALHTGLQQLFANANLSGKRPGTTLTMLELRPGEPALLYHVGDSRLIEICGDSARALTVDHVPATACAMQGLLSEQDWFEQVHEEHRSQISQAFILGNAFANPSALSDPLFALTAENLPPFLAHLADRRALALDPEATYLLATDGFWACAEPQAWLQSWPAMLAGSTDANDVIARLFAAIGQESSPTMYPDNITAVVIRPLRSVESSQDGKIAYDLATPARAATP
jgi:serine/threonine protein phosphatase PrpC